MNPISKADRRLMQRAAAAHSPGLDRTLIPLSNAANNSRLWLGLAAGLGMAGGRFGRRAALRAVAAIGLTSALVNGPLKHLAQRRRPIPATQSLLHRVPVTTSFPSGHAASAAAFATAAALESPLLGLAAGALAVAVAASRVYAGVHYPSDVVAGAAVGCAVALGTTRTWPRAPHTPAATRPRGAPRAGEAFPTGRGVSFVVNPNAGPALSPNPAGPLAEALPDARIVETSEGLDLVAALREAVPGARALGIAGGDGSVNTAAGVALQEGLPLVVVPAGTLNHLARDVGLVSVQDSIDALTAGAIATVDVATIDGRPFLNTASFGSYVELVDAREQLEATIGKWPAVVVALVKVLRHGEPVRVEINGRERNVWMIFIGNCRYHPSGFAPTWRETMDDGQLDVRIVDGRHPWARSRLVLALLTGTLGRSRVYEQTLTRRLDIRFLDGEPYRLARDGETFDGSRHFTVEKSPQPLQVYVGTKSLDGLG